MIEKGNVKPDERTYFLRLRLCEFSEVKRKGGVRNIILEMINSKLKPTDNIFSTAIKYCRNFDLQEDFKNIIEDMKKIGLIPNTKLLIVVVSNDYYIINHHDLLIQLFTTYKNNGNIGHYSLLLNRYCSLGLYQYSINILNICQQNGIQIGYTVYSKLKEICDKNKNDELAMKFITQLKNFSSTRFQATEPKKNNMNNE
jgi:hypothetical protein